MTEVVESARIVHHLFTTPDVSPEEILVLARTRWPSAKVLGPGSIRLSRYTTITGPWPMTADELAQLGVRAELTSRFDIDTLLERGEAAPSWGLDPSGLHRAFADALPIREERRVAEWLIAAARRLIGLVWFAPSGALVEPDPDSATDIDVVTDVWLEPDALLLLVRSLHPNALMGSDYARRSQPTPGEMWRPDVELDHAVRAHLHAMADAVDAQAVAMGPVLDGYSVVVGLGDAGVLSVEVTGEEPTPPAILDQPWAADGVLTYHVRWRPENEEDVLYEFPDEHVQQLRSAMATLVADIAALVYQAVGGEILDADGFLIAPGDL